MKKKIFNIIAIIIVVFLAVLSCYYDSCNNGQHSFATMLSGLWSAAATVVLGFIAVWQNMQYKKLSDDYNDSLQMPEIYRTTSESDTILGLLPEVWPELTGILVEDTIKYKRCKPIPLLFFRGPLLNLHVKELVINDNHYAYMQDYFHSLRDETTPFKLTLDIPEEYTKQKNNFDVVLTYENIYGINYEKTIHFSLEANDNYPDNIKFEKARRV